LHLIAFLDWFHSGEENLIYRSIEDKPTFKSIKEPVDVDAMVIKSTEKKMDCGVWKLDSGTLNR
jgi:hypothetical protein